MENEEPRYLSEPMFRKILEKCERLASSRSYGIGYSKNGYLVLNAKGKLSEMWSISETDQRTSWSRRYVRPISPGEAIDIFDLSTSEIKEMPEKARKLFLDYIEEEEVPDF